MFCNQCEETARGSGCTVKGVCGKESATAGLQDVLIYLCKGIAVRNLSAMEKGTGNADAGLFIADALFATLTNVNFDPARFNEMIRQAIAIRDSLPRLDGTEPEVCTWTPKSDSDIAVKATVIAATSQGGDDITSLRQLLTYGMKGIAAYYTHAAVLGSTDETITTFLQKGLAATVTDQSGAASSVSRSSGRARVKA